MAKKKQSEIDLLVESAHEAYVELKKFMVKHQRVLDAMRELEVELESRKNRIKDYARSKSKPGETVVIVDNEFVRVKVNGVLAKQEYDWEKANKHLTSKVVKKLTVPTIDPDKVKELVDLGEIEVEELELFEKPREKKTPAVFIEWADTED